MVKETGKTVEEKRWERRQKVYEEEGTKEDMEVIKHRKKKDGGGG